MKRMLIVEDEPDAADAAKMIKKVLLEREGYSVEYPRKGPEMLKDFGLPSREVLAEMKIGG